MSHFFLPNLVNAMMSVFSLCLLSLVVPIRAFSTPGVNRCTLVSTCLASLNDNDATETAASVSRRDWLWKVPVGAIGCYAYGKLAVEAFSLSSAPLVYPTAHESRVTATIAAALTAATVPTRRTLRILEVGIGSEARLIRRGLYDEAIHQLAATLKIDELEITGLDLRVPTARNVLDDATAKLETLSAAEGIKIGWKLVESSIEERHSQFTDGYFDAILCCLTLCSVDSPVVALDEIKRLLRPSGGTLGYIEHVAVDESNDTRRFLAWQQQVLDPLQQRLADNCHLRRHTQQSVEQVFQSIPHRYLQQESFFVDNMWPVSRQTCGVLQLTA